MAAAVSTSRTLDGFVPFGTHHQTASSSTTVIRFFFPSFFCSDFPAKQNSCFTFIKLNFKVSERESFSVFFQFLLAEMAVMLFAFRIVMFSDNLLKCALFQGFQCTGFSVHFFKICFPSDSLLQDLEKATTNLKNNPGNPGGWKLNKPSDVTISSVPGYSTAKVAKHYSPQYYVQDEV